jgi:phosphoserine phosphatase
MPLVATLVSNPAARALPAPLAHKVRDALRASALDWLADDIACDVALPAGLGEAEAAAAIAAALDGAPVDFAVQEAAGRRKRLLIADMDSTMIDQECIDELADEVGIKAEVSAITAMAMNNEIAFEPALRQRVALLAGLDESVIERLVRDRITLAAGARELVATMNRDGAYTALVSGGFDAFTSRIAAKLGFREHRANRLLMEHGRLTGKVAEPILGREAKAAAIREITAGLGIGLDAALAVGDGANDLDMLALAGAGVALHAKPTVAAQARIRIDHGDLTALLYLQGYRRAEFAA